MARGFYAHRVQSTCIDTTLTGAYFNEATAHIICGDQMRVGMSPHTMFNSACYENMDNAKGYFPASYPMTLAGPTIYDYGRTHSLITLPSIMHFDAKELKNNVGPYNYTNFYQNTNPDRFKITFEGWRLKYPMVTLPLARKFSSRKPIFDKFKNVYWTDMYPYPNPEQEDLGLDWLGHIYNDGEAPSYPMMHSLGVQQPFLGQEYYEDTLTEIDKSRQNYLHNFMPFCRPITIYDIDSNKIGYADGLAFQLFIFNGVLKNRLHPVLEPKIDPNREPKLIPTSAQYWSVELWTYLSVVKTSTDPKVTLKSPRLHTHRWWYYTQPYGYGVQPGTPYMFWKARFNSFLGGATVHTVRFNLLQNQNNTGYDYINAIDYNTPWTDCSLYLTA